MPTYTGFTPGPKAAMVAAAVAANAAEGGPKSWRQLARELGVSNGMIDFYRRKQGLKPPKGQVVKPPPQLALAQPSSREERVNRVAQIAESPRESTALKALELLEEWERASGNAAGPGAPLTTAEEVVRLGVLLECASDESLTLVLASNKARILRLLKLPAEDLPSEVPPAAPLA